MVCEHPDAKPTSPVKRPYCAPVATDIGLLSQIVTTKSPQSGDGGGNVFKTVQQG